MTSETWAWAWISKAEPEEIRLARELVGHMELGDSAAFESLKRLYNAHMSDAVNGDCARCKSKIQKHFKEVARLSA